MGTPTPTATPIGIPFPKFKNEGFEQGANGVWKEQSSSNFGLIIDREQLPSQDYYPHTGEWLAWLGGGSNEVGYIKQMVNVDPARPYVQFYHWVASIDSCGGDLSRVFINGDVVDTFVLCTVNNTGGWATRTIDVRPFAGQKIDFRLQVETNATLNSNYFVDDFAFVESP